MAAYVLKSGTVQTNTNGVIVGDYGAATTNSYNVCVSPLASGACGAAKTFQPGDFKFSLFGYTRGGSYALPSGTTHIGIRVKMALSGTTANLTLNNGATLENIGSTDVTKITLIETTGDRRTLQIDS